jgi:hypothetical protein
VVFRAPAGDVEHTLSQDTFPGWFGCCCQQGDAWLSKQFCRTLNIILNEFLFCLNQLSLHLWLTSKSPSEAPLVQVTLIRIMTAADIH